MTCTAICKWECSSAYVDRHLRTQCKQLASLLQDPRISQHLEQTLQLAAEQGVEHFGCNGTCEGDWAKVQQVCSNCHDQQVASHLDLHQQHFVCHPVRLQTWPTNTATSHQTLAYTRGKGLHCLQFDVHLAISNSKSKPYPGSSWADPTTGWKN